MRGGKRLLLAALSGFLAVSLRPVAGRADSRSFDEGWLFHRGDAPGADGTKFDDSSWRHLELPHDWSIEDLPPRDQDDIPVLEARDGHWLFEAGDDSKRSQAGFDDTSWSQVTLPNRWAGSQGYGWYRRHLKLPDNERGRDLMLDLGTVMGAEETFLNGEKIGGNGDFPPNFEAFWSSVYQRQRSYLIPAKQLRSGDNVLAVRVYSPDPGVGGIYDPIEAGRRTGPFDPGASPGNTDTGYAVGGVGWYRKRFTLDASDRGRAVYARFDGVYMDSDVWLNGRHLGNHPYGYTSFEYELTPYLRPPGEPNLISVRVRNLGRNSRWYSGSGIYRHTWLRVAAPAHVATWGVSISTPEVGSERATVQVTTRLERSATATGAVPDAAPLRIRVSLLDSSGVALASGDASALAPALGASTTVEQALEISHPTLWSVESPHLYRAKVELLEGGAIVDATETSFGIRSVEIDVRNGLRINGKSVKLRGGCFHHDHGPLGSMSVDRAEERTVELMKANGYNAIRCSHNPPAPAFLDAADRLGMLVMDEAFDQWNVGKNADDYHLYFAKWWKKDIEAMVLRDRNHPSVILWSIGNEIPERATPPGARTARQLADYVRTLDPTRKVTASYNKVDDGADPFFSALDVAGYNYDDDRYASDHQRVPDRIMVGTESFPSVVFPLWQKVESMPWVIGDFVWTATDYLGESGIGHANLDNELQSYLKPWPWHMAYDGDFNLCGEKRPQSFYRDVIWGRSRLEMVVHRPLPSGRKEVISPWGWPDEARSWTWPGHEGEPLHVRVFSSYPTVRLLLNGVELGVKPVSRETELLAEFDIPYQQGRLVAQGIEDGRVKETRTLETAGPAVRLRLSGDRGQIAASRNDLAYMKVEALDAQGRLEPLATDEVSFSVSGPAAIAGVCSGSPTDLGSFQASSRKLFGGQAQVIVRPTGTKGRVQVSASAPGLMGAEALIEVSDHDPAWR